MCCGCCPKCCSEQCRARKFLLEHYDVSEFYLSCCQKNGSALPLLCVRAVLFTICFSVLIASAILSPGHYGFKFWLICLTKWGLIGITLTTGTSFAISCIANYKGPIEANSGLPWYVKVYWALFNISAPFALFTTFYFYYFLVVEDMIFTETELDILVDHGNSIIMLVQLLTSRQPVLILHFYWSLLISIIYIIFSVILYICGGKDSRGDYWYLTLDWKNPDITIIIVICLCIMMVNHLALVALAGLRDCLTRPCRRGPDIDPVPA